MRLPHEIAALRPQHVRQHALPLLVPALDRAAMAGPEVGDREDRPAQDRGRPAQGLRATDG